MQDRRQFAIVLGQTQDVHAFRFRHFGVGIGEDVKLAAASLNFLEVRFQLVEQLVVRGDGDNWHVGIDQRQRAMFEFAGRVGFGVDIGDLLELQGAFHGDRVMPATAEEKGVVFVGKTLCPDLDIAFELKNLVDRNRQMAELVDVGAFLTWRQAILDFGHDQRQQEECAVCRRDRDRSLSPRSG